MFPIPFVSFTVHTPFTVLRPLVTFAEGDANSPLVTSTVSSFGTKVMADILWTKDIQIFIIIKLHEDLAKETAEISHLAALRNTSDL